GLEDGVAGEEVGRSAPSFARHLARILHHPLWAGGQGLPPTPRDHVVHRYATARLARDVDRLYTRLARERGLVPPGWGGVLAPPLST
ncbi:MAG: hypothetical protein RQ745_12920, partial [Longimicrobiales bacterium]|nr:hypothetical protein [Longimicrobiales bacterium]